jgi:hypothetical protein
MLPSHISRDMRMSLSAFRYAVASSGVLRSGSLTISRRRSARAVVVHHAVAARVDGAFVDELARVLLHVNAQMRMRFVFPSMTMSSHPLPQMGSSYCEIW